jgi:hypothetical protein
MRKILGCVLLVLSPAAWAGPVSATWMELQVGAIVGNVEVPCPEGGCSEGGLLPAYTAHFTHRSGSGALRIRGVRVDESGTSPDPRELAFMVGGFFGDSGLLTVGGGRIFAADDERPAPVWGLAWELAFAPPEERPYGGCVLGNGQPGPGSGVLRHEPGDPLRGPGRKPLAV